MLSSYLLSRLNVEKNTISSIGTLAARFFIRFFRYEYPHIFTFICVDCASLTCTEGGGGVHLQNSKEEINIEDMIWNTLSEVRLKISKITFMLRQGKK